MLKPVYTKEDMYGKAFDRLETIPRGSIIIGHEYTSNHQLVIIALVPKHVSMEEKR